MIYFTSDTHYGHSNVIGYCGRPFRNVHHMNQAMICNFNERVSPGDTTYHLGDFAFLPRSRLAELRSCLNGKIILIRGNHDKNEQIMLEAGFDEVHNRLSINLDGHSLYMSHIPIGNGIVPRKQYNPELVKPPPPCDYHMVGHVHERWTRIGNTINCGVDAWQFNPVMLQQLIAAPQGDPNDGKNS